MSTSCPRFVCRLSFRFGWRSKSHGRRACLPLSFPPSFFALSSSVVLLKGQFCVCAHVIYRDVSCLAALCCCVFPKLLQRLQCTCASARNSSDFNLKHCCFRPKVRKIDKTKSSSTIPCTSMLCNTGVARWKQPVCVHLVYRAVKRLPARQKSAGSFRCILKLISNGWTGPEIKWNSDLISTQKQVVKENTNKKTVALKGLCTAWNHHFILALLCTFYFVSFTVEHKSRQI